MPQKIPKPTVKRLALYLRELEQRLTQRQQTISSHQLGDALGLTDAQVRKDLACFGAFGHAGIGYRVDELVNELRQILKKDRIWNTAIIGAGNLGRALVSYGGWKTRGFEIVAVFDVNPDRVGTEVEDQRVRPMDDLEMLIRERDVRLAMVAVPGDAAQDVADRLIAAGIKGILNFAPRRLEVHHAISISSVDLALSLEQLAFQVSLGWTDSLDDADSR